MDRVEHIEDIDGDFVSTAWRQSIHHTPQTLWADAEAIEAWVRAYGKGRYYWRIDPEPKEGRWRLEFVFSDPDTAVAFRIRWG